MLVLSEGDAVCVLFVQQRDADMDWYRSDYDSMIEYYQERIAKIERLLQGEDKGKSNRNGCQLIS